MTTEITISINAVRKIVMDAVMFHYQQLDDSCDFKQMTSIQQSMTRLGFDVMTKMLWEATTIEEINTIMHKSGFKVGATQWIEGNI